MEKQGELLKVQKKALLSKLNKELRKGLMSQKRSDNWKRFRQTVRRTCKV